MTLVELLMALAGVGLIGAAVASMLTAVSYGTASSKDLRAAVVKHKTIAGRLNAAVRSSTMVLAQGDGYLVLWMADTRENDAPNLSEIRRIEFDSDAGELRSYKADFPDNWDEATLEANDTQYGLGDSFNQITTALKAQSTFPGELWANGVTAWEIALNDADVQAATLVSYRVTLSFGDLSDTFIAATSLRRVE